MDDVADIFRQMGAPDANKGQGPTPRNAAGNTIKGLGYAGRRNAEFKGAIASREISRIVRPDLKDEER